MYEASVYPEDVGWERVGTSDADRALSDGWLTVTVDLGVWAPVPGGEQDFYRKPIPEFTDTQFFLEWKCITDAPSSEIPGSGGIVVNAAGFSVINHFTISEDEVSIWRGNTVPITSFDIDPAVPHTYRIEAYKDQFYVHYIDGQIVDSGTLLAPFPNSVARIVWGSSMWFSENTTQWDYIRYGTIPLDGSGDYDSDGQVDGEDLFYFDECFLGSDVDAGPGCRFADFDFDTDVDCDDWTAFTQAWTGPDDPPAFTPCAAPPPAVPTASARGCLLMCLVMLLAGGIALPRSRVCG